MTLRPFDYLAFAVAAIAITVSVFPVFRGVGVGASVRIRYDGVEAIYPLSEDREIVLPGPDGMCRIEIAEATARVAYSACAQLICVRMGRIRRPGEWVACLPHNVLMTVEGRRQTDDLDAVTF